MHLVVLYELIHLAMYKLQKHNVPEAMPPVTAQSVHCVCCHLPLEVKGGLMPSP